MCCGCGRRGVGRVRNECDVVGELSWLLSFVGFGVGCGYAVDVVLALMLVLVLVVNLVMFGRCWCWCWGDVRGDDVDDDGRSSH